MSNLIASLSAKKANPTRGRVTDRFEDDFSTAYQEILQKYNRTELDMADWMESLGTHVQTLQNIVDISEDKISVTLATANAYGSNAISNILMTVHAALTCKYYAVPFVGLTTKVSNERKEQLNAEMKESPSFIQESIGTIFGQSWNLKVDRDHWYDKHTDLHIDTTDMLKFLLSTSHMPAFQPLRDAANIITSLQITTFEETLRAWKFQLCPPLNSKLPLPPLSQLSTRKST